jgi:hypothetical protein
MVSPFIKDPSKILSEKDAQELEKALTEIKQKYPAEAAAFNQYIDRIQARIEEGKKQKEAGDVAASKKSYDRGESEARKLLAQVNERDRAEEAFRQLQETKQKVGASAGPDRPNLLRWIALEKEKDASDAFTKNDFSGARILCGILNKVHELSLRVENEDQALASLAELSTFLRKEAEAAQAPAKQAWLFDRAKDEEEGARQTARDKLYPQAAERFILAAFLYEKAKEVALESAQAGRH